MTGLSVSLIVAGLIVWMLACSLCGYRRWYLGGAMLALSALAANVTWMAFGLRADPLTGHALTAHAATILYAVSSFGFGWILSRFVDSWRSSRVRDPES